MTDTTPKRGGISDADLRSAPTLTPDPDPGLRSPVATRTDVSLSADGGVHPDLAHAAGLGGPSAAPDPWIGRTLSNVYRVTSKIGEGGMGAVYLAEHIHLRKPYAVKVLTTAIAQHEVAVERLRQEAIAASSIEHDNIVDVVNFDRAPDGSVYIVMELLRGEGLHERIAAGPLPPGQALPIAWQICDALGAAHARGIVHRDLKPENIFLARRGEIERVKVLDFGISKVKSADAEAVRMTRTGQLVGTPLYMSPEQARGEQEIDARVDIYALGVILFEMLSGQTPFDGRNYFELLWKHGNEPPPGLRERVGPAIPEELDAVVARALAKDPKERFASMEALGLALEGACPEVMRASSSLLPEQRRPSRSGSSIPEAHAPTLSANTPPTSGRTNAGPRVAAAVAVALAAAAGAWALGGPGAGGEEGRVEPVAAGPTPPAPEVVLAPDPVPAPSPEPGAPSPPSGGAIAPEPGGEGGFEVSFGSVPAGAEVRVDGAALCTTPCRHALPEGPAELVFHREGYLDQRHALEVAAGASVEVRLVPRRRPSEGPPSGLKTKL